MESNSLGQTWWSKMRQVLRFDTSLYLKPYVQFPCIRNIYVLISNFYNNNQMMSLLIILSTFYYSPFSFLAALVNNLASLAVTYYVLSGTHEHPLQLMGLRKEVVYLESIQYRNKRNSTKLCFSAQLNFYLESNSSFRVYLQPCVFRRRLHASSIRANSS